MKAKEIRIKELFVFLLIFALFLVSSSGLLRFVASAFGLPEELVDHLAYDNELLIQAAGLLTALVALRFLDRKRPAFKQWFRGEFFGRNIFRDNKDFRRELKRGAVAGFLSASGLMALMVFLGHAALERVNWDMASLLSAIPRGLGQVTVLGLWIVARLLTRSRLRRRLIEEAPGDSSELSARLLLIGFESVLLFRVFETGEEVFARVLTYLVCALLAASFQVWEDGGLPIRRLRRSWRLAAFEFAFLAAFFHLYGLPRGILRLESMYFVFPGPRAEAWGWLAQGSLANQFVFVLFAVFAAYRLAHAAWKRWQSKLLIY